MWQWTNNCMYKNEYSITTKESTSFFSAPSCLLDHINAHWYLYLSFAQLPKCIFRWVSLKMRKNHVKISTQNKLFREVAIFQLPLGNVANHRTWARLFAEHGALVSLLVRYCWALLVPFVEPGCVHFAFHSLVYSSGLSAQMKLLFGPIGEVRLLLGAHIVNLFQKSHNVHSSCPFVVVTPRAIKNCLRNCHAFAHPEVEVVESLKMWWWWGIFNQEWKTKPLTGLFSMMYIAVSMLSRTLVWKYWKCYSDEITAYSAKNHLESARIRQPPEQLFMSFLNRLLWLRRNDVIIFWVKDLKWQGPKLLKSQQWLLNIRSLVLEDWQDCNLCEILINSKAFDQT